MLTDAELGKIYGLHHNSSALYTDEDYRILSKLRTPLFKGQFTEFLPQFIISLSRRRRSCANVLHKIFGRISD